MGKIIKKLLVNLVNNSVLKDTILLTNKKTGKRYMFDTFLHELKSEKIYGICAIVNEKKYAIYSNDELYTLMCEKKITECEAMVIPMDDLKLLK
jgi:uncharacterized membrane protein